MFSLTENDLKKIPGCCDGPAAFNKEVTQRGGTIISADPLYAFSAGELKRRREEIKETVMTQMKKTSETMYGRQLPL